MIDPTLRVVYVKIDGVLGYAHHIYNDSAEIEWYIDGIRHYETLERDEFITWTRIMRAQWEGEDIL